MESSRAERGICKSRTADPSLFARDDTSARLGMTLLRGSGRYLIVLRHRICPIIPDANGGPAMIRKLKDGRYRLYSRKKDAKTGRRRNLGTFRSRPAAMKHERAVQFFKRGG